MAAVFEARYSPALIRFYLAHWEELQSLAEGTGGALGEYLRREWEIIQSRRSDLYRPLAQRRKSCVCDEQHTWSDSPRGGGGSGDAGGRTRRLLADLELAAEQAPAHWEATRRVFRQQQRDGQWEFRRDVARRTTPGRPRDRWPEPHGSDALVVSLMARSLGWRACLVPSVRVA